MRHAAAPAIELPDQHALELLEPGIAEELVEPRPAGDGAAESRIYLFLKDLPALLRNVLAEFVELHFATLV